MIDISKDKSTLIKGIAILMLLWVHLFDNVHIDQCNIFLYIGDTPLVQWLARAFNPIPIFVLLSGYGLAYKYETGKMGFGYQLKRVLRLYVHYWVILTLFLVVGHMIDPSLYPGRVGKLLRNMIGWDVSYNSVMWFILPYSVLSLLSYYIIRFIERIGNIWALAITIVIDVCATYLISRHGDYLNQHQFIYQPILCFHLLFSFTVGVVLRRMPLSINRPIPQWIVLTCIAILVIITCMTPNAMRYIIYVPLLIILLNQVKWGRWTQSTLIELGRKSMPIWMIHTWLSHYLFMPQFYSLKYMPLIFIAVLGASYLLSIPVMWIAGKINNALLK